ncbi:MAG: translocation/assembly module TamB domain-containing protein [Candidatus Aminicenantes bacterium]|nr:MAG: translocation/assembly module TamB domain-containing protein [Candidatus Aminicenantes bacterium]
MLPNKIEFRDLSLGVFPLSINIRNLKEFPIKDKNIVSFKKVSAEIPFFSLFSKIKTINLYIHQPKIILDDSLLKKGKKAIFSPGFKINKINIIDAELVYTTPKLHVNLLKCNLLSFPRANFTVYRLTSPHLKVVFPWSGKEVTFEGQMVSEFRRLRNSWKIGKFYWQTPLTTFNLNGRIYRDGRMAFNAFTQGSARQILDPLLDQFSIREFAYGNFKIKKNKEGRISVYGQFNVNTFTFGGKPFKDLRGTVNWDNKNKRTRVNAVFRDHDSTVDVRVEAKNKVVKVFAQNASAAKITQIIDIYEVVPLGGILKEGNITIHKNIIKGTVDFVPKENGPADDNPHEFNAGGHAEFIHNTKTKAVHVFAPGIQTEFGQLTDVEVNFTPKEKTQLTVDLKSTIKESAFLDKYSTFYIDVPLNQWKLSKGNGTGELHLKKINDEYFITSDLLLRDFSSCGEKISSLKGHIETEREITRGLFNAFDKDLNGEAKLLLDSKAGNYKVYFNNLSGEAKKLVNILELDLDLQGRMKGNFIYSDNLNEPNYLLTGTFQADKARFYAFDFENARGTLKYEENTDTITIKELTAQYMTGDANANMVINYIDERFTVNGKITGIDFNLMNNQFEGKGDIIFSGEGRFEQDPINLTYRTADINLYEEQPFKVEGKGKIFTNFSDHYYLETNGDILSSNTSSPVSLRLNQINGRYDGRFHGEIKDINLLIPWGDNQGQINIDGRIFTRANEEIGVQGHADFKGKFLSFPNFAQTLDDFHGDLLFNDLNFTLRSLYGTLGGGKVEGSGALNISKNQVNHLFLQLSGKNMTLNVIDRCSFTLDGALALKYVDEKLLLSGDLDIHSGLWEREVDEGVQFYTDPTLSASGSTLLNMLVYDLRIVSKENVKARNSVGEVQAKLNLRLSGDYDFPVLSGVVESRKGLINFSSKKFDLVKGKLIFKNRSPTDPDVDIESEAFIKNYRIKLVVKGLSSMLNADLQSSPPLPTRDILTLISVGELFRRPTSSELINQWGIGATGLIASELTEQIKKRTKKIFGEYVLTIDPNISNISGAADASRLIVGKEVLRDFLILYATNFSTRRQEVVYVQYQLSPTISLIGMRNEEGLFSIDLRFRNRKQR